MAEEPAVRLREEAPPLPPQPCPRVFQSLKPAGSMAPPWERGQKRGVVEVEVYGPRMLGEVAAPTQWVPPVGSAVVVAVVGRVEVSWGIEVCEVGKM